MGLKAGLGAMGCLAAMPAAAQTVLDRADPASHVPPRPVEPTAKPQAPVPVEVEAPSPAASAVRAGVTVGAVRLVGLQVLTPADFADVVGQYVGRFASPDDLAALAGKIAARARARGYVFASARIAPQRLAAGVLTVAVDEGRIDEVRLDGPDQPAVRAALAPLVSRRPVTLAEVERRLLIAGDIDGVRVRSSRYLRDGTRGILVVRVVQTPLAGRVAITNDGTRPLGPEQVYARLDLSQLLFADDALSLAYTGALAEPGEFQAGRVRYGKRISPTGTELAISGGLSHARPGAYLGPLDISGRSWSAGLSLLQPLERRRAASLWVSGDFDLRDFRQSRFGAPVRHDRLAVARLGVRGVAQLIGGRLRAGATLSRGLDLFDATKLGDPLASRPDADGRFTSFDAWADLTAPLGAGFSIRAAAESQVADAPLLVSEEMGLGGTAFLRGYDWSERSGDAGAMGSLELRYDIAKPFRWLPKAQPYLFVDGGRVRNLKNGYGGGGLASAGGGVRFQILSNLEITTELAKPLSGPRYETGDSNPRFNFGIAKAF